MLGNEEQQINKKETQQIPLADSDDDIFFLEVSQKHDSFRIIDYKFITFKQVENFETSLRETPFKTKCPESSFRNEKSETNVEIQPGNEFENIKIDSRDEPIEDKDLIMKNVYDLKLENAENQKYVDVLKKYFGYNSFRPYVI